ncbi:MAG: response regulator transcription factor [Cytophagaceae bacterium]|nr:response regulator transcription factor [Cytophagaceae bacterium]
MNKLLRILLADDHALIADSIRQVIESYPDMEVVASVRNGRQALSTLAVQRVDVLVCDWHMPLLDGPGVLRELRQTHHPVPVLVLSMEDNAATIRQAFQAGATGFMTKTDDIDEFPVALRTVAEGRRFLSHSALTNLSAQPDIDRLLNPSPHETLTDREREVLRLIARQLSGSEIADKLFISEHTVKSHRKHLLRKLGVKNGIGLVQYALQHGLLENQ